MGFPIPCSSFDAVGQETGLTLARPVEKVAVFRRQRKNKAHPILGPQGIRMKVPMEFKSNKLIGTSVTLIGDHGPFWKVCQKTQIKLGLKHRNRTPRTMSVSLCVQFHCETIFMDAHTPLLLPVIHHH